MVRRIDVSNVKGRLKRSSAYSIVEGSRGAYAATFGRLRFKKAILSADTFLVGHPKSGNTWMAYLLAIVRGPADAAPVRLAELGRHVPVIHGADQQVARHAGLPRPRIFRNEWPVYPDLYPRTVYVVRDPRAVVVSMYHMYRITYREERPTLAAFVEEYLTHGCIRRWEPRLVRWDRQVEAWMGRERRGNRVLTVRYEDMLSDLPGTVDRVTRFVGLQATSDRLALAVARGSFESMRREEEEHGAEAYPGERGSRGRFIRRGEAEGWRDELDPRLAEQIASVFAPTMERLGYRTEA